MKTEKTNVARLLDKAAIPYNLIPYEVDETDLSAIHVAEQLNTPLAQLFKTLVLRGDKIGYFVCVIPGAEELDLKKSAKISRNKSCDLIPMKDLLGVAGYVRGACSPVGMKKLYPTYIHQTCLDFENIYISAGKRGLQVFLSPIKLTELIHANIADLIIG